MGDLYGDGRLDLVVPDMGGSLRLLRNAGAGTFSPMSSIQTGLITISVAVADLNGDGRPDIAFGGGPVRFLLNEGGGMFENAGTPPVGVTPLSLVIADLNGDGRPDLAFADGMQGNVTVLLQSGCAP
jgi:Tfp pilus tip-associated adhesin PilY1